MNRFASWALGVAILIVASVAVATAPQSGTLAAPFRVVGAPGEPVSSRTVTVEVEEVRLAEQLDLVYDGTTLQTPGVWVVVDVVVSARLGPQSTTWTDLAIGGTTFRSKSLPHPSLDLLGFGADVPMRGTFAFEVPASALEAPGADRAEVRLQPDFHTQLDSIAVVIVDLTGLELERRAVIEAAVPIGAH